MLRDAQCCTSHLTSDFLDPRARNVRSRFVCGAPAHVVVYFTYDDTRDSGAGAGVDGPVALGRGGAGPRSRR